MEAREIISCVKDGKWKKNMGTKVQDLVLMYEKTSDSNALMTFVKSFIEHSARSFSNNSHAEVSLIRSVLYCYDEYVKIKKLKSSLVPSISIATALYRLLFYLKDKVDEEYDLILQISAHLNEELESFSKESLTNEKDIASKDDYNKMTCNILWNAAVSVNKNMRSDKYYLKSLTLRKRALMHLSKTPNCLEKLCKNAISSSVAFCRVCEGNYQPLDSFYCETFELICQCFKSTSQNLSSLHQVFLFGYEWINNYILNRQSSMTAAIEVYKKQIVLIENIGYPKSDVGRAAKFYREMVRLTIVLFPFEDSRNNFSGLKINESVQKCCDFLQSDVANTFSDIINQSLDPLSKSLFAISSSDVLKKRLVKNFYSYFICLNNLLSAFLEWDVKRTFDGPVVYISCLKDLIGLCRHYFQYPEKESHLAAIANLIRSYGNNVMNNFCDPRYNATSFVTTVRNLTIPLYSKKYYNESSMLMSLCNEHLIEMIKKCPDELDKINFANKLQTFVYSLCQSQRHVDCLRFISSILDAGYRHQVEAADQWAVIKQSLHTNGGSQEILKMTILDATSEPILCDDKKRSLLKLEFNAYKRCRLKYAYDASVEMYSVMEQLLGLAASEVDRAACLIKMARVLADNAGVSTNNPADLVEEAIRLLTCNQGAELSIVNCHLAHAYYCKYIIAYRSHREMSMRQVDEYRKSRLDKKVEQDTQNPGNFDTQFRNERQVRFYGHITLSMDLKLVKALGSAVSIWENVINSNMNIIPCVESCLEEMIAIAEMFSMLRLEADEFKVWMLASKVASAFEVPHKLLYVSGRIISMLSRWGATEQADALMLDVKSRISKLTDETTDLAYLRIFLKVCESELCLMQNKVLEGWNTLKVALEDLSKLKRTSTVDLLKGEAKLLESKYCVLPHSVLLLSDRAECSFALASSGLSSIATLTSKIVEIQYDKIAPRIVNCLLDTCLHLSKLYVNTGAPREAMRFMKLAQIWSYKLCLANRAAEILLALANVAVLGGSYTTCETYLYAVEYILESEGSIPSATSDVEEDTDEFNEEFVQQNISADQISNSPVRDIGSSPKMKSFMNLKWHSPECDCVKCKHVVFLHLYLKAMCLQADYLYQRKDDKKEAIGVLRTVQGKMESCHRKEKVIIRDVLSSWFADVKRNTELEIFTPTHFLILEITSKLALWKLKDGEIETAYDLVKQTYSTAHKQSWISLQETHVTAAHFKYLYCLIKIVKQAKKCDVSISEYLNENWSFTNRATSGELQSNVDLIAAKVGDMNLKENTEDCFKTPNIKNVRELRKWTCRAPPRKLGVLSVRNQQFDEDDFVSDVEARRPELRANVRKNNENISPENQENERVIKSKPRATPRTGLRSKKSTVVVFSDVNENNDSPKIKTRSSNNSKDARKTDQRHKITNLSTSKIISLLESAISAIIHIPHFPLFRDIHLLLALCKGNQQNNASNLLDSIGVAVRQQFILASTFQLSSSYSFSYIPMTKDSQMQLDICRFNRKTQELHCQIPKDYVVCQINVMPEIFCAGKKNPQLLITRLQHGRKPIVVKICNYVEVVKCSFSELQETLKEADTNRRLTNAQEWWNARYASDDRVKVMVKSMEDVLLGFWKCLLCGSRASEEDRKQLQKVVTKLTGKFSEMGFNGIDRDVFEVIVDSVSQFSECQLKEALASIIESPLDNDRLSKLCRLVQFETIQLNKKATRQPTVLILDKEIQNLPWECMSILMETAVSRMPSIYFVLLHSARNNIPKQLNPSHGYFVLNPDNNLPKSQARFSSYFESLKWNGVTQRIPTKEEWLVALENKDLFVYVGHGSGQKFCDGQAIQTKTCQASVLLAGCSSVRLDTLNVFEPDGIVHNYFIAGSPCIFGTLWNVTDKEIDLLLKDMLQRFLSSLNDSETSLTEALVKARSACRLYYITGAGAVVYGMPVIRE